MNEPVIHGHAVGNARGRGLTDPQPIISPEQAARDKAWTEEAIDLGYLRPKTVPEMRTGRVTKPRAANYRQRGTQTSQEDVDRMRAEGWMEKDIAARLGISTRTLHERHGAAGNGGKPPTEVTEARKAKARELLAKGLSVSAAAREIGIAQQSISDWIRRGTL